jgi:hypothetical protein
VAITALGLVITFANIRLPIVRNALVYAKMSIRLLDGTLRISDIPSAPYGKGLGFPLLALPFVGAFGPNAGVQIASAIATVIFVAATVIFFRRFGERAGLNRENFGLGVVLACFNPLVMYQFWSGYADSLFAAAFLAALVALDKLIVERTVRAALLYVVAVYASMVAKNIGVILPLTHALYAAFFLRDVKEILRNRKLVGVLGFLAAALAVAVQLGRMGLNPTLPLNAQTDEFVSNAGAIIRFIGPNAKAFGLFLLLSLNVSVSLLFTRSSRRREVLPLYLAAAGYCATMFAFYGSWFNIRFYFCVLPVLVLGVLPSLLALAPRARTVALALTLGVNAVLVANYNLPTVYASVPFPNEALEQNPMFDNLRTGQHLNAKADLDRLNALPPHAPVVLAAEYYQDAAFGVYEQAGLLRPDLDVRFARLKVKPEHIEPGTHIWFVSAGGTPHDAFVRAFCKNWGVQVEPVAGHVYLVR